MEKNNYVDSEANRTIPASFIKATLGSAKLHGLESKSWKTPPLLGALHIEPIAVSAGSCAEGLQAIVTENYYFSRSQELPEAKSGFA